MDIKGKVVIVTGASYGIGHATAKLLAKEGAKVALTARSADRLKALSKELPGSLAVTADMTKEKDVRKMIEKVYEHFGRIDALVNNAGQGYDSAVELVDTEKFRRNLELNVIGPLVAMQAVIPIMRKQGAGAIVNVSSGTALMYLPEMGAYSSSKRALGGLTLTAREELAGDGIVVSIVYPYITLTDFEKNTVKASSGEEQQEEGSWEGRPKPDTAEFVAEKILDTIKSGVAEQYVHDWMKPK
jgi:NAD(P)-dependent dehydrogenase (short-subunit alcohol dehydrogenase family)